MKKIISLLLVTAMLFSMAVTASAKTEIKTQIIGVGTYSSKRAEYTFEGLEAGTTVNNITAAYAGNNGAYGLSMSISSESTTALVAKDPADETNMVLDINSKTVASSDQLVSGGTWQHSGDYHIMNVNLYFTGNDRYKFTATTQGKVGTGTSTSVAVNVEIAVGNNSGGAGFYANGVKVGNAIPKTNQWFNFKIITNQSKPGYDMYVDNVKINDTTIACANTFDSLGTYTKFSFGASKDYGSDGHMYMDNFVMSCSGTAQAEAYETFAMDVSGVATGDVLPVSGSVFTGVPVSWTCSDDGVTIDNSGKVNVKKTSDGNTATLTATIGSQTKEFTVVLSAFDKQLKKGIHGSYSSRSVDYTFDANEVGDTVNTITPSYNGGGSDGGYLLFKSVSIGSDPGNTALIAQDPVNSSNKVLDIHSIAPTAAEQIVSCGTWQHTSDYHIFEMDLYITGNDRYKFIIGNRSGTAVNFEMGVGNNAGGAGFYVGGVSVGTDVPPANEWFNFKIIMGPNQTYDILINDKKINKSPLASCASNTITSFKFGAVKDYGSDGHMYVDNLFSHRASYANAASYEKDVMNLPEYISNGDVLTTVTDIFRLPVTWNCSDANVTVNADGVVTIPEGCDGEQVTFTANINNSQTKDFTVTLNGYNLYSKYTEDFEYHWLNNKSISERPDWSVVDENRDPSVTHSISSVVKKSENPSDAALAVQVYRVWENYAQLAKYTPTTDLSSDYSVYSSQLKLPEVANQYVTYIQGEIENSTGSKNVINLAQLIFNSDGTIGTIENSNVAGTTFSSSNKFPRNQWFRLDVVFDNSNQTFDIYVNNEKFNDTPVKVYGYKADSDIKRITQVQVGVPRYYWRAATYYIDNISMMSFDGKAAAGYDVRSIKVGANTESGAVLPVRGTHFGSTITWASSNSEVLSVAEDGKVTVKMPGADTPVTLTATVTNNGKTVSKAYNTTVLSDSSRLNTALSTLTGYVLTGQKYVKDNFTANVPGIISGDVVTLTSSDPSAISVNGVNATVTQGDTDKYVDVTVSVTSAKGGSASKTIKLYVISKSEILSYDGFDYKESIGTSIANKGGWTVENENLDASATGSTHIIKANPDDATDTMVDIEVFRNYGNGNQLMKLEQSNKFPNKTIVQTNMKFPDSAGNRYLYYIQGTFLKQDGSTHSGAIAQFYIYRNNGTINCESIKDGSGNYINLMPNGALPTNQWFNYKLEFDCVNRTFDLYVDNVKQNVDPVPYYTVIDGARLISIDAVRFGVSRYSGNPGHLYIDDHMVRAEYDQIAAFEADMLNIPTTFASDFTLPGASTFDGCEVVWQSSKESVISNTGVLGTVLGFGTSDVTLTANVSYKGETASKVFNVKAVKTPYFTVDNIVFTDGGNDTYTPVSGGTIKNVSVTKYDTAANNNAKVVVAVYDRDSLVAVSQPMAVTQSGTINLNTEIPSNGETLYAKAFVWDMETMNPLSYEFRTANELDKEINIFSIGDSTMQSYGTIADRQADGKMTGWAQVLSLGFDSDYVTVENHGRSGKSTRSFTEQGYIFPVYENMKQGDYLIIQFAHNDQKPWDDQDAAANYAPLEPEHFIDGLTLDIPEKYADYKTYEQWLRDYVKAARIKGVYPVFATSIRRRQFDENGKVKNSHVGYPEAMVEVAKELNVPVIDLQAETQTWINNLGVDNSLQYFCASYNGSDNTHLTYSGAVAVANLAIDAMKEIGLPIGTYATEIK